MKLRAVLLYYKFPYLSALIALIKDTSPVKLSSKINFLPFLTKVGFGLDIIYSYEQYFYTNPPYSTKVPIPVGVVK